MARALANAADEIARKAPEPDDDPYELARRLLVVRRALLRSSSMFADPALTMLLDLLALEGVPRRTSISSLCVASGAPMTTALRHLETLRQEGLVMRHANPADRRSAYVELTPAGRELLLRALRTNA